jgi:hypothetical protein
MSQSRASLRKAQLPTEYHAVQPIELTAASRGASCRVDHRRHSPRALLVAVAVTLTAVLSGCAAGASLTSSTNAGTEVTPSATPTPTPTIAAPAFDSTPTTNSCTLVSFDQLNALDNGDASPGVGGVSLPVSGDWLVDNCSTLSNTANISYLVIDKHLMPSSYSPDKIIPGQMYGFEAFEALYGTPGCPNDTQSFGDVSWICSVGQDGGYGVGLTGRTAIEFTKGNYFCELEVVAFANQGTTATVAASGKQIALELAPQLANKLP